MQNIASGVMVKMGNNFINEHDCEKAFFLIEGLFPTYTLGSESHYQITSDGVLSWSVELNGKIWIQE